MKRVIHATLPTAFASVPHNLPLILILFLSALVIAALVALYLLRRRDLKKIEEALVIAERASAAKGNFMSRVSHEIRTPLNAIIGYNTIAVDAMVEAKNDASRKQAEMRVMDCLTKSEIASRHLLTVINDVLDMSAIESGKIEVAHERFDFKGLINSLTVLFYAQAKAKNVKFTVVFGAPTEEWFIGDQMRVNQILTNLLSNAVKFTPEGGSVRLSVEQKIISSTDTRFHFEVSDTGIGMAPDYLSHIWTPFEQADSSISRRFGGTGLGMSIAKKLVDLMDGTIDVQSAPGHGTDFTVELTMQRTEQPLKTDVYDFSDIKALVIDDDVSTCDYIKLLFDRCGAACTTVTSGKQALSLFSAADTNDLSYNLCLVDWHMPGMDGIETVRHIRGLADKKMPIIVVTAYDFSEITEGAKQAGVTTFVSKPLFQSSLFDLLANISGSNKKAKIVNHTKYDFSGARVLLAEDNKMNMEIAKRILESAHFTVDCAWDGREVVDKFEAAAPDTYQAILMDVHMPERTGYEATRLIRTSAHANAKTVPIIAMTADALAENVSEAHAAGMVDHIAKPIDVQTLFITLGKYVRTPQR